MQIVGVLRWTIEFGRIDIFREASLLSQYQANTQVYQPEALYHVFAYLNIHMRMGRIGYDPIDPNVYLSVFNNNENWT